MSKVSSSGNSGFILRYLACCITLLATGALLLFLSNSVSGPSLYILYPAFYWPIWVFACAFFALLPRFTASSINRVILSIVFVGVGLALAYLIKGAGSFTELAILAGIGVFIAAIGYFATEFILSKLSA